VVELAERFKPDLVVALPRPDRAAAQVGALLDLGLPLFAEKPLGLNADQVWPLVEPGERGWVTVAFPNRLAPIWAHLDRLRAEGRPGSLVHLSLRLVKGSAERYIEYGVPWMLDPARCGGGPLRNFGIHHADLIGWQLGPRKAQVVGATLTRRSLGQPIEDYGVAVLRTDDGIVATIEVGYSHPAIRGNDAELRVAATGAYLIQRGPRLDVTYADGTAETCEPPCIPGGYRELFFDALRRFRRGDPPLVGVRACALANEIVDAIYNAATSCEGQSPPSR
jgi:predicted dehydrogenase